MSIGRPLSFVKVKYRLHEDYIFRLDFDIPELGDTKEPKRSVLGKCGLRRQAHIPMVNLFLDKGFAWDGCSGPMPDRRGHVASAVHDALYALMRDGVIPWRYREDADREFRNLYRGPRWLGWLALKALLLFGRRALRHDKPVWEAW